MHVRSQLDIGWRQLSRALGRSAVCRSASAAAVAHAWHADAAAFLTLRTAWDALLAELALPAGSELLASAVNIPDMFALAEHHGLVVVPVDMDPHTLTVDLDQLRALISERTRLVLVASLLGTRHPTDALFEIVASHGIPVVEDLAQAWGGDRFYGDPRALASLFSFGPIKTSTALGGCLARISDADLRQRLQQRVARYPRQRARDFGVVALRYLGMKAMSGQLPFSLLVRGCALAGRSHDALINRQVLGLRGDDYWAALRRQPAAALLRTLEARLAEHNPRLARRAEWGDRLAGMLPDELTVLGRAAQERHWWLLGLAVDTPDELVAWLRRHGFDATSGASRLVAAKPPPGRPDPARIRRAMERVVYVPAYPELPASELQRLAGLIAAFVRDHGE